MRPRGSSVEVTGITQPPPQPITLLGLLPDHLLGHCAVNIPLPSHTNVGLFSSCQPCVHISLSGHVIHALCFESFYNTALLMTQILMNALEIPVTSPASTHLDPSTANVTSGTNWRQMAWTVKVPKPPSHKFMSYTYCQLFNR